jgi:signal transduction histidine kinase
MRTTLKNGLNIIDLVRKMRSLEEKKAPIEIDVYSLNDLIAESKTMLRQKLLDKDITLIIDINKDFSVKVERTSFINSVINNLISNAVKFSNSGSKIELIATKIETGVSLRVRDYGIGIPEEILNNLFTLSKPTSRTGTKGEMGTGFGMPLVKKFMEVYGGSIDVRSKDKESHPDDHGTEVILRIPGE